MSKTPTTNYQLPTTKRLRVAIVCDWLLGTGGAERVVLELHRMYPDAPIYTSKYDPNPEIWYGDKWFSDADVRTTWLQILPKSLKKFLAPLRAWTFSRLDLSGYDLVISSSGAEAKAVRTKPKGAQSIRNMQLAAAQDAGEDRKGGVLDSTVTADRSSQRSDAAKSASGAASLAGRQAGAVHVSYCHSPTHYYWSRYEDYMKHPGFGLLNPLARLGLKLLVGPMRKWDYKAAQRPDYLIANSNHTKEQIKKYYGRDSVVIHPPVDVKHFKPKGRSNRHGFVVAGRQTPYKRIDLAVAACNRLDLPLKVIGGGPDHQKLVKMAGSRVTFHTNVTDSEMPWHFQQAEAFIFPSIDDFGIVAVEAMAAGTPVIALKGGGALDYVKEGKSGVFFDRPNVDSLCEALSKFDSAKFKHSEITKQTEHFSPEVFDKKFKEFLKGAMA